MGDIRDAANTTFRDVNDDGTPNNPAKPSIRYTFGVVEDAIVALDAEVAADIAALETSVQTSVNDLTTYVEGEVEDLQADIDALELGNGTGFFTYATVSAMNADSSKPTNSTAQTLDSSLLYRYNGSAWVSIGSNPNARLAALETLSLGYDAAKVLTERNTDFFNAIKNTFVDYNDAAVADKAISLSTGAVIDVANRHTTDFIPFTTSMAVTRFGSTIDSGLYAAIAFYNSSKVFISASYVTVIEGAYVHDGASAPVGTAFIRLMTTSNTHELYVYDKKLLEFFKDMLFSTYGKPHDQSGTLTAHYINKTTGAKVSAGSLRLSNAISVNTDSYIAYGGGLISPADVTQAVYAFFDGNGYTFTVIGSPGVFTKSNHGFAADDKVIFTEDDPLPPEITADTVYYVLSAGLSGNVFRVSATQGGTAVDLSEAARINVKRYLGYYNPIAKFLPIKVGTLYPTATLVYVTMPGTDTGPVHVLADTEGEPEAMEMFLHGSLADFFADDLLDVGYINSSGVVFGGNPYRTSKFIPAMDGQVFRLTTGEVTALGPTVAGYNASKAFVSNILPGRHLADYTNERIEVPRNLGIKYIRALTRTDLPYTPHLYGARAAQVVTEVEVVNQDLIYFDPEKVYGVVGSPIHMFPRNIVPEDAVSVAWAVDPAVLDTSDREMFFTVTVASPAVFTTRGPGPGYSVEDHEFVVNDEVKLSTTGALPTGLTAGAKYFVISGGLTSNTLRLSATKGGSAINTSGGQSGIHSIERYWGGDSFYSNEEIAKVTLASPTPDVTLKVRAITNGSTRLPVATIDVKLSPSVLYSPSTAINIVGPIGDSTTEQLSDNGTWINEVSRLLTGVGAASLTVDADPTNPAIRKRPVVAGDIPAAGAASNIYFRGTRGGLTVKHEGRSGWSPLSYLTSNSVLNKFWNAANPGYGPGNAYKFDFEYYINTNNFDEGSTANGVNATGSNMLVPLALGWNDVFEEGATSAAASAEAMAYIIDNIHSSYPDAMVWVLGLWPPAKNQLKNNSAGQVRYYSKPEVYDIAIRGLGKAYREMVAERDGPCEFVPVAHVFDSEMAFNVSVTDRSRRTTYDGDSGVDKLDSLQMFAGGDFVHPGSRGYSYLADAFYFKFRYDYCRG